jgi:hypothetical protein
VAERARRHMQCPTCHRDISFTREHRNNTFNQMTAPVVLREHINRMTGAPCVGLGVPTKASPA